MRNVQVISVLAMGALLAACQQSASPTPAPVVVEITATPAGDPTATAQPPASTPTPAAPSATPAPFATSTAAVAVTVTPDPNEGVGDVVYADALSGGAWYWTYEDDAARFGVSGETKLLETVAKQANAWRFTSSNDTIQVGDQQLRVRARVNACAEADEYALLFRGSANADYTRFNFYAVKLRCDGRARLELLEGPDVRVIADWAASPAIRAGAGAENELLVWAYKDQFRLYVNGEYLFTAQDASLGEGFYGFYLYDRTHGNMSVSWMGLEARAITLP